MPYYNISESILSPIEGYCESRLRSKENQVYMRGVYLVLTPASFATRSLDTVIGLGGAMATFATLGKSKKVYTFAARHLSSSRSLLAEPYSYMVCTLNPRAEAPETAPFNPMDSKILNDLSEKFDTSTNIVQRHIISRATYAVRGLTCVVTSAAQGAVALISAPLSILTFGKAEWLNGLTFRTLHATNLATNIFYCSTKFINPWSSLNLDDL